MNKGLHLSELSELSNKTPNLGLKSDSSDRSTVPTDRLTAAPLK